MKMIVFNIVIITFLVFFQSCEKEELFLEKDDIWEVVNRP